MSVSTCFYVCMWLESVSLINEFRADNFSDNFAFFFINVVNVAFVVESSSVSFVYTYFGLKTVV